MKTKHTPGPWRFEIGRDNVNAEADHVLGSIMSNGTHVARIWDDAGETIYECFANTNLIAAAPELLEALESLIEDCEHASGSMDYNYGEFDLKAAKAAIKKAKGE